MSSEFSHIPVLLSETIDALQIKSDGTYLDGTVGGAGHSYEIARRLTGGRLFCIDKDIEAIRKASEKLKDFKGITIIEGDFRETKKLLEGLTDSLDGALLDLGVSSHQLDTPGRGFSYLENGPLDMRMSQKGLTAEDIVNNYSESELADIFFFLGEESNARLIAGKIVNARIGSHIKSTTELAELVISALPPSIRRKEKNPCRKVFTALRIAVNDEFEALKEGIEEIFSLLNTGGRLCIITFHSLEDRITKQSFQELAKGCTCPPDFPICVCNNRPKGRIINKKPINASSVETEINRRARSAKLRIIEKI